MKLYLIRHAIAVERHLHAKKGETDAQRPLTDKGVERMAEMLDFLKAQEEHIDTVLHSPYQRCRKTVDLFTQYYPSSIYKVSENLKPDHSAARLYEEIIRLDSESVALVGHEPDLGQFIGWLLFRQATDQFPLKKSGMAKLDVFKEGRTILKWMVSPKLVQL